MKILMLFLFVMVSVLLAHAQEPSVGIPAGGGINLPANARSKPTPRGTSLPANCSVGELFFDTDATAGQNMYGCTATDTWTLLGDGGGAGGGDNISVNGSEATNADFDSTTPAAPANGLNVIWQKDASSPNNVSAHILQSAGTDITADLEEEAHVTEHAENGADELPGEALGTACTENQILKANATGGLDCAADATGGSPTFDQVGAGTNTNALVIGVGGTLGVSGSGTIAATSATTATTATTANAGDSATAFFPSGTLEATLLPAATATAQGAAELATAAEVATGTDTGRTTTPSGIAPTIQSGSYLACADAGANDTYTCSMVPVLTAYTTGMGIVFKANTANTGAATLNIDSLGAKTVVKLGGGITTALSDNDIRAGQWTVLVYDGTNFQMQGQLGNAAGGSGIGAIMGRSPNVGVGASTANYDGPFSHQGYATGSTSRTLVLPVACTAKNLFVDTGATQSATGSLVVTLRINDANTALTVTIAAGAAAGTYSDTSNTVSLTAGNLINLELANNATVTSTAVKSWTFQCQ